MGSKKDKNLSAASTMRSQAEQRLHDRALEQLPLKTEDERQRLFHELQVHQIELEMQNDELRRAQEELEFSRDKYLELYDFAPVGYFTFDGAGVIREVNLTGAQLLGIERRMLVDKPFSRFIAVADERAIFAGHLESVTQKQGLQRCELRLRGKDGSFIHGQLQSIAVANPESNNGCILSSIIDATGAKQSEEALQEKNLELEDAWRVAEKANHAKSEFLSGVSHELRSPLNAILGFAQLLEKGLPPPSPKQKSSIEQIIKAGWYLLKLINEILDLALIDSGRLSLSIEPMALDEVIRECQAMVEPLAQKNGISISFPQFETPYFVYADRTRVKQVLINLFSNAIKYNSANGMVEVTCRANAPGRIRIGVQDTGGGLSAEQIAQLFQPFNRLGREIRLEEGTGIGLVVTKRLVEMMDGIIGVESSVGVGTVFWIELNLADEPEISIVDPETLESFEAEQNQGRALRLLLYIEDNQANMQLVEQLIGLRSDLRLLGATDGPQGLALAKTHLPEVILMDINLPGISGDQVLKILREDSATSHIPVIAISANAMPHDIERSLGAGFFHYLTKPIKINEFMETLDVALKYAETHAALVAKKINH